MRTVAPILTGTYLASGTREAPSRELMAAMGMPVALGEQESAQSEVNADSQGDRTGKEAKS